MPALLDFFFRSVSELFMKCHDIHRLHCTPMRMTGSRRSSQLCSESFLDSSASRERQIFSSQSLCCKNSLSTNSPEPKESAFKMHFSCCATQSLPALFCTKSKLCLPPIQLHQPGQGILSLSRILFAAQRTSMGHSRPLLNVVPGIIPPSC